MVTIEELQIRESIATSSRDDDLDLYKRIKGGEWPEYRGTGTAEMVATRAMVSRLFERVEHNAGLGHSEALLTFDDILLYLQSMWMMERPRNVALEKEGRYGERFGLSLQHARVYALIALLALRVIGPFPVPLRWVSEVSCYLSMQAPA